jgi:alpha/beta superfamily hydrolase
MNSQTEKRRLPGPAGDIEVQIDNPVEGPRHGVALIAHPHPLFGGTMDNKVVQTIARAFVQAGWVAVRFNFRGVGASAGVHDEGRGEADDMALLLQTLAPNGPIALAGFSFGAFVAAQLAHRLESMGRLADLQKLVLVGTATSRFNVPEVPQVMREHALVLHGEADDTVALSTVMEWARPQVLPVTVIPGGGHFFHGQLPLLKGLVLNYLSYS